VRRAHNSQHHYKPRCVGTLTHRHSFNRYDLHLRIAPASRAKIRTHSEKELTHTSPRALKRARFYLDVIEAHFAALNLVIPRMTNTHKACSIPEA
jgi:hypothetical protein